MIWYILSKGSTLKSVNSILKVYFPISVKVGLKLMKAVPEATANFDTEPKIILTLYSSLSGSIIEGKTN